MLREKIQYELIYESNLLFHFFLVMGFKSTNVVTKSSLLLFAVNFFWKRFLDVLYVDFGKKTKLCCFMFEHAECNINSMQRLTQEVQHLLNISIQPRRQIKQVWKCVRNSVIKVNTLQKFGKGFILLLACFILTITRANCMLPLVKDDANSCIHTQRKLENFT